LSCTQRCSIGFKSGLYSSHSSFISTPYDGREKRRVDANPIWEGLAGAGLDALCTRTPLSTRGLDIDTILDRAEKIEANGEELPLALEDVTAAGTAVADGSFEDGELDDPEAEEGELPDSSDRPPAAQEREEALRRCGLVDDPPGTTIDPTTPAQGSEWCLDSVCPPSTSPEPEAQPTVPGASGTLPLLSFMAKC
jgi:hypothetical protein